MLKTILAVLAGAFLAVLGTMLAALVVGERKKLTRESAANSSLGTAIKLCVVMLIVLVVAVLLISLWASWWFLLVLIPITLFTVIGLRLDPQDPMVGSKNRYVTKEDYELIQSRWKKP